MTPEQIEKVKAEHPRAVVLTAGGVSVAVVPPTRQIWRRFKTFVTDEKRRSDAYEVLLRDCLVHPDAAGLESILDQRPALAETFGAEVAELAGAGLEVEKNG